MVLREVKEGGDTPIGKEGGREGGGEGGEGRNNRRARGVGSLFVCLSINIVSYYSLPPSLPPSLQPSKRCACWLCMKLARTSGRQSWPPCR